MARERGRCVFGTRGIEYRLRDVLLRGRSGSPGTRSRRDLLGHVVGRQRRAGKLLDGVVACVDIVPKQRWASESDQHRRLLLLVLKNAGSDLAPRIQANHSMILRRATPQDLDYLVDADVRSDIEDERIHDLSGAILRDRLQSRAVRIEPFVRSPAYVAWVATNIASQTLGTILYRVRDRALPDEAPWSVFSVIPLDVIPDDGRFFEIYQLWVEPGSRRQGVATRLKLQVEEDARRMGVSMIYTHTAAVNEHIVSLNLRLGYREIRRGSMWDDIERASLVRSVPAAPRTAEDLAT